MDQQQSKTPVVALRMPERMIERVDEFREGRCVGRAEAIRRLVEAGLKREEAAA
jgi:metal-responsive CopG/Arc/MetJ family transcriptional regulator